ncbi:cyclic pyranopterin phosphate synthase [Rubritalea squalenifaciens DSM 18772]|uniref:cyclic pyranopterin monophosphate synthase n=1 Tax=Rubritalea squalenifaciens DSM 18772 TaxID=1123071 RepID=A0A1M6J9R8_9BACT|nr:cyclic pyranopterin monophosphate synthase MoaC [Rubritalea squalenifaciens]SHJ43457.1 cyclic pyranopterin phosphate synthase [Rubritalea squalenifaciens DSM 18772]
MLSHIDPENNQPGMVDVSSKAITQREATAESIVILGEEIMAELVGDDIQTKKGPVFQTAIIAGTMAVKKTSDLIPLCHPLPLEKCKFSIAPLPEQQAVRITCTCLVSGKTGVEMEALTGASVAALTIYDMCKAMSHDITINQTRLVKKTGGKSDYAAQ